MLIGGGARSGKSHFAVSRALAYRDRYVLATGVASDDEMQLRISKHRDERADRFVTIEEPYRVVEALDAIVPHGGPAAVVLDCLTTWVGNLMWRGDADASIERAIGQLAEHARRPFDLSIVTNEVGMAVVPESALGRRFRDVIGRAQQQLSAAADEVVFVVMGTAIQIKPTLALVTADSSVGSNKRPGDGDPT